MGDSTLSTVEGGASIIVLIAVLAVVLEVLVMAPGIGIESNPLGFLLDWMGGLTDGENSENNDDSGSNGGLW